MKAYDVLVAKSLVFKCSIEEALRLEDKED